MLDITIPELFFIFMIYAVLGWVWEVSYVFTRDWIVKKEAKFVNIGGPVGPYAPIYGVGLVLITLAMPYVIHFIESIGIEGVWSSLIQIITILLIATTLEYTASYVLEKIFNTRWWDYTTTLVHINGRVCMSSSLFFGIGGFFMYTYVNPLVLDVFANLSFVQLAIIFAIFYTIFLTDVVTKLAQLFKINPVVRTLGTVQKASSDRYNKIKQRVKNSRFVNGNGKNIIKEVKEELDEVTKNKSGEETKDNTEKEDKKD